MRFPGLRKKHRSFYYDAGGKPRKWIPLGSDEQIALRRYHELRSGKGVARPTDTVDCMLKEYELWRAAGGGRKKITKSTLRQYGFFSLHLSRVFGDQPATALTQADVARYLELCPRTNARGEIAFLSGAYQHWMALGRVVFNPCLGARCDRPRSHRTRILSAKELNAVLDHAPPRLELAIELAYCTGLRISDLVKLRWDNFGEGESIETGKTGARLRFVLDDGLRDLLARAKRLQGSVASLYVLSMRSGRPLRPRTIVRWWHEACAGAGVEDAQWRDLRAVSGTEVARLFGLSAAQAFLGHTTPNTTRIYLRGKEATTVKPLRLVRVT